MNPHGPQGHHNVLGEAVAYHKTTYCTKCNIYNEAVDPFGASHIHGRLFGIGEV